MKRTLALSIAVVTCLAACGTTLPVLGRMEKTSETFDGTVAGSGYSGGTGELALVSSRNARCKGSFVYTSRRRGEGVLECDDGRTGPFHVVGVNTTGNGYGDLNGQRYTFTFGPRT